MSEVEKGGGEKLEEEEPVSEAEEGVGGEKGKKEERFWNEMEVGEDELKQNSDGSLLEENRWKVENAVTVALELLREGREIQRISVIRHLTEMMQAHPEECTTKVLPLVQEILQESDSLDLHCEGAAAYKNILTDKSLLAVDSGLSQRVLNGVFANLGSAKEFYPNIAWLETLLDVSDQLSDEAFRQEVLPLAIVQSQQSKPVKSRIAAVKLFEKLAGKVTANEIKTDVIPCVQSLCQDVNALVRAAICERLPEIAKALNCVEYRMIVLPMLVELCNDEDLNVQEKALESVRASLCYFDKETVRNVVVPLLKRSAERSLQISDTTLAVIAKNLGPWCLEISNVISGEQRSWFLTFFTRLAQLGSSQTPGSPNFGLMTRSDPVGGFSFENQLDVDPVHVACRDWCAYNFPGIVHIFGAESFLRDLFPVFHKLCQDSEEGIRRTVAGGFHEVVKLLKGYPMDKLISSFIDLIRLGDPDVVGKLTPNLGEILPVFYSYLNQNPDETDSNGNFVQKKAQLNRILLACNRLVRNNSNWRCHEDFLNGISCLVRCCESYDELHVSFIPMLKEEILTVRAIPCRVAACRTLLIFMREASSKNQRLSIIEFFIQTLAHHQSCHKRCLYLDVCREVLELYSRYFFKKYFLTEAIKLVEDRVSNVRVKACKMLPVFKKVLVLPLDEPHLCAMENAVKKLLTREQTPRELEAVQTTARDLSLADTGEVEDVKDRKKLQEEFDIFGGPELTTSTRDNVQSNSKQPDIMSRSDSSQSAAVAKPPSVPSENSPVHLPSGVRIRKPRTAIVRPQPKLVVTRAPSPRPTDKAEHTDAAEPPEKDSGGSMHKSGAFSKRISQSASDMDLKASAGEQKVNRTRSLRSNTMLRPPAPVSARKSLPATSTREERDSNGNNNRLSMGRASFNDRSKTLPGSRVRGLRTGSVRQSVQMWESVPSKGAATLLQSFDQNGNNGFNGFDSAKSGIPIRVSLNARRNSLPGNERGSKLQKSGSQIFEHEKLPPPGPGRSPYGLMKVQSASAIQQSSASVVSMRSRRKF